MLLDALVSSTALLATCHPKSWYSIDMLVPSARSLA